MLLPDERRVLLESDAEIHAEMTRLRAAVHPWYGGCDSMGADGSCKECAKCIAIEPLSQVLRRLHRDATEWTERPPDLRNVERALDALPALAELVASCEERHAGESGNRLADALAALRERLAIGVDR